MRVKLFSHGADPDGLGCVVLASLGFKDLDYTLCKDPADLNEALQEFFEAKEYVNFDKIFITDLCPADEWVARFEQLKLEIQILDHHTTSKNKLQKEYPFVTSMEEKDGRLTCATELFFEFLCKEFGNLNTPYVKTFVEYTRLHDTYDWERVGNVDAYQLQTLFQHLGWYGYFLHFQEKCQKEQTFSYDKEEINWIVTQEKRNRLALEQLLKRLRMKKEENITYSAVIGNYEYRNLLADEVKKLYPEVDIFLLLACDNGTVSFRSLKEIPVEGLAASYGGGGHIKAASCKLTKENELKLIKRFILE